MVYFFQFLTTPWALFEKNKIIYDKSSAMNRALKKPNANENGNERITVKTKNDFYFNTVRFALLEIKAENAF